jgi:hypothetical protein
MVLYSQSGILASVRVVLETPPLFIEGLPLIIFFIDNPSFEVFIKIILPHWVNTLHLNLLSKGFSSPISELKLVLKIC